MPVNKNALKRYKIIDKMLSDPNNEYTTDDIMKYVNRRVELEEQVSLRMIQKDIKALEEDFGKEMVRNARCRGSVKYSDQSEPLFYQKLSLEEEEMLKELLKTLGSFDGLDNFTWLELLKKKFEFKDSSNNIPVISFSKNDGLQIPTNLLGRLFVAIFRKKVIKIKYTPFGKDTRTWCVYPYQLKQFNDRWFLICNICKSEEYPFDSSFILNLALDRMAEDFEYVEDEPFIETTADLRTRFDEIVGVTLLQENNVEDIYFAVDNKSLDYVRTKWLHITQLELDSASQELFRERYPSLRDMTFFSIECRENQELYARLASYMNNIVVVEPREIRKKLASFIYDASAIYATLD